MDNKDFLKDFDSSKLDDVSKLSKEEMEKRMMKALEGSNKEKLGNMMNNLSFDKIKDKLTHIDPSSMGKIIDNIKNMDSAVLEKIKNAVKGKGE